MICIHHNDLDGKCAAAIVNRWHKDDAGQLSFVEMDYARVLDFKNIVAPDELVIIVDFSLKPEVMEELLLITRDIIWIDHHVTAKDYPYQNLPGLRNFADKAMAGCELAWNYFFPDEPMPESVRLIGDYDKWALKLQPGCFQFYEGMKLQDCSPLSGIWRDLLDNSNSSALEILTSGVAAIKYRDILRRTLQIIRL